MQPGGNPYSPPAQSYPGSGYAMSTPATNDVSALATEHLRNTKPWVTFLGVLGFVLAGFMVLGGLFLIVASGSGGLAGGAFEQAGVGVGVGIVYMLLALFYVVPSLFLVRYGGAIKKVIAGGGTEALDEALGHQKSFWKYVGIFTLVMMVLYGVFFLIAMVAGVAGLAAM